MEGRAVVVVRRMVGVPLFDDEVECSDGDTVFALREGIVRKHGGTLQHVRLWHSKVEPSTILRNMHATLRDAFGLQVMYSNGNTHGGGVANDSSASSSALHDVPRLAVYYDYDVPRMRDALLAA